MPIYVLFKIAIFAKIYLYFYDYISLIFIYSMQQNKKVMKYRSQEVKTLENLLIFNFPMPNL